MAPSRIRHVADALLVALFLAALCAPLMAQVTGVGQGDAGRENRPLGAFPRLRPTADSLAAFPGGFRIWYEHRFGLREPLVRFHNRVKAALGVSTVERVLIGKENWLFLDRDWHIIEQHRGMRPLDAGHLGAWRASLADRQAWLAARGIPYLLVVVPEKSTLYPEKLPDRLRRVSDETPLDQLVRHMARSGPVSVLDLRAALAGHKSGPLLYERTDSHWSSLGAYVAYREIVTALAERHGFRLVPQPLGAFRTVTRPGPGGDLARMLALEDVYRDTWVTLVPKEPRRARQVPHTLRSGRQVRVFETKDRRLPRAVVFHDSFIEALHPFLSEHFERATYSRQFLFSAELVEAERPDVVIQELAERWVVAVPREEPPVLGAAGAKAAR